MRLTKRLSAAIITLTMLISSGASVLSPAIAGATSIGAYGNTIVMCKSTLDGSSYGMAAIFYNKQSDTEHMGIHVGPERQEVYLDGYQHTTISMGDVQASDYIYLMFANSQQNYGGYWTTVGNISDDC